MENEKENSGRDRAKRDIGMFSDEELMAEMEYRRQMRKQIAIRDLGFVPANIPGQDKAAEVPKIPDDSGR